MENHLVVDRTPYDLLDWATESNPRCLTEWVPEPIGAEDEILVELRPDIVPYRPLRVIWVLAGRTYARSLTFHYRDPNDSGTATLHYRGANSLPTPAGNGTCHIRGSAMVVRNMPEISSLRILYLVDSWEAHLMAREYKNGKRKVGR